MAIIGTTYDAKLNKAKDLAKQNLEDAIANESKINEKIPSENIFECIWQSQKFKIWIIQ